MKKKLKPKLKYRFMYDFNKTIMLRCALQLQDLSLLFPIEYLYIFLIPVSCESILLSENFNSHLQPRSNSFRNSNSTSSDMQTLTLPSDLVYIRLTHAWLFIFLPRLTFLSTLPIMLRLVYKFPIFSAKAIKLFQKQTATFHQQIIFTTRSFQWAQRSNLKTA